MILRFLFFIQTFLKYCKALSTEKYKRCINILLLIIMGTRQILFLGQPKKAGNVAGEGASPCGTPPVSPNGT